MSLPNRKGGKMNTQSEPKRNKRFKSKNFEKWVTVPAHTSYLVSNYGRIRNKRNNYILKPVQPSQKCKYVRVLLDGKLLRINRIVAMAFIPNPKNKPIVHHKDRNPLNNNVNNLQWVTEKEHKLIHKAMREAEKQKNE